MSKATIIRDNFFLQEDEKQALLSETSTTPVTSDHGASHPPPASAPVEERISPQTAAAVCSSAPSPATLAPQRLNGKAGESRDQTDGALPEGQSSPDTKGGNGHGGLNVHDCDKKRGNKCCSVM